MLCINFEVDEEGYVCFELDNGSVYDFSVERLKRNPGGWIFQIRQKNWFIPEMESFLREVAEFKGDDSEIKPGNLS